MAKHLVFQTAFIGDSLLSIPLVKAIKYYYPNDEVHIFCRPGLKSLLESYSPVDLVIHANKSDKKAWKQSVSELLTHEYENVFCPHESFRSALAVKKIKAKHKLGFSKWWNFLFFNKRIKRPMQLPDALRQMSLLSLVSKDFQAFFHELLADEKIVNPTSLDLYRASKPSTQPFLSLDLESHPSGSNTTEKTVALAPGSVWMTKRWDKYEALSTRLIRDGYKVLLLGSPQEQSLCENIASRDPAKINNLCGQGDLKFAYEALEKADLLVSNDSGLMHLACAAQTPVVSIFGPTTLALGYQPWSDQAYVMQKSLSCRPCGKHGHNSCPIGTHECMKAISVNDVMEVINKLITS